MSLAQHLQQLEDHDQALQQHVKELQERHGTEAELPEEVRQQLAALMQQRQVDGRPREIRAEACMEKDMYECGPLYVRCSLACHFGV